MTTIPNPRRFASDSLTPREQTIWDVTFALVYNERRHISNGGEDDSFEARHAADRAVRTIRLGGGPRT